ncbi:carboxypeptidase-like regulatory domain-containing protein [bacterium]|nr:carboxypeptidase-like regulatory domain-containing protein [bacterium]
MRTKYVTAAALLCLLAAVVLPVTAEPQTLQRYTISGIVFDAETSEPLRYVNVFLSNTSLGGVTDDYGRFTIRNVPPGTYELVAAMIGYGREIKEVTVTPDKKPGSILFRLVQESLVAPTITVTARRDRFRDRDLRTFETILLGIDEHAGRCTIENPEVLRFSREAPYFLQAAASEPLHIHNPTLGYDITYFIDEFVVQNDGRLLFTGNIQFTPVTFPDPETESKVMANRVRAYQGSMEHFFRSLISDSLESEGFALYALSESPLQQGSRVLRQLGADSLVFAPAEHMDVEISLPEWIKVVYSGEGENPYYSRELRRQTGIKEDYSRQISYLNSMVTPLVCARSGHLLVPQLVIRYGHWAFDRLAEMLPMNYHPDYQLLNRPAAIDSLPASVLITRGLEMAAADSIEPGSYYVYAGLERLGESSWSDTLFMQLADVLNDEERRSFQKSRDKAGELKKMLERRDPSPATPENEFLWEHWQRLAYARSHYAAEKERGYDDRGMVYVKYGAPFSRRVFSDTRTLAGNECWIYHTSGSEVVIDFVTHGSGFQRMKYVREMTPDGLANPGWAQLKGFIGGRVDNSYQYRMLQTGELSNYRGFTSVAGDQETPLSGEALQVLEREYRMMIREGWERLPVSMSDLRKTRALLPYSVATARFYREGQTRLECYIAVPWDALTALPGSNGKQYAFRRALALRDAAGAILHTSDDRMLLFREHTNEAYYITQINYFLDRGDYSLAVELQNSTAGLYAEEVISVAAFEPSRERIFISDIQFTDSLGAAAVDRLSEEEVKGDMYISPFPFERIERGQTVTVYVEAYNLMRTVDDLVDFRAVCKVIPVKKRNLLSRINIFSGGKPVLSDQIDKKVTATAYPFITFELDTAALETGEYRIVVTLYDRLSGQRTESERILTVFDG